MDKQLKKKVKSKLTICLLSFGIPIVLIVRLDVKIAILATLAFMLVYFFLPTSKVLRKEIRVLDIFVFLSFGIDIVGCWLLYINGFEQSANIWLFILIAVFGFPIFRRIERIFNRIETTNLKI